MFNHSTNTASFFSVLMAAFIFSLSLEIAVCWAQGNTSFGTGALQNNTTGSFNTATGSQALFNNTTGSENTASGFNALTNNTTGSSNTAIGSQANVSAGTLNNATAIGFGAIVNASNKIRLGNDAVTVIEGKVLPTMGSDKTQKENFKPVDGEEVLEKIRCFELSQLKAAKHKRLRKAS